MMKNTTIYPCPISHYILDLHIDLHIDTHIDTHIDIHIDIHFPKGASFHYLGRSIVADVIVGFSHLQRHKPHARTYGGKSIVFEWSLIAVYLSPCCFQERTSLHSLYYDGTAVGGGTDTFSKAS